MIQVISAESMREMEDGYIRDIGWPQAALMERAALAVDGCVGQPGGSVVYLCGQGNNGGDGLAAARLAAARGVDVIALKLSVSRGVSKSPSVDLQTQLLRRAGVAPIDIADITAFRLAVAALRPAMVVDALFGLGFRPPLPDLAAQAVAWANALPARRIAVDLPSGLETDSGRVEGQPFRADLTVTFGWPKRAHIIYPAREMCGDVRVCDIGLSGGLGRTAPVVMGDTDALDMLPGRARDAHKKSCGLAVIAAGSRLYAGAAALCAQGAVRSGAGLVTALCVPDALVALRSCAPETVAVTVDADLAGFFAPAAAAAAAERFGEADALAVGPGFGLGDGSRAVLVAAMSSGKPLVLDADALTVCARSPELWAKLKGQGIITPHPGEAGRILNRPAADIAAHPISSARALADRSGGVALLKGATTVIAEPGGRVTLNVTGTQGLATAGSGDVLTGLIAGLLAQGVRPYDAARLGAYLHGRAGELAQKKHGMLGMTASDVASSLGEAFASLG